MEAKTAPIERRKLVYDFAKHLTTLSAGSLVALVTFFEKFNNRPTSTYLLSISLVLFVVAMLLAALAQFIAAAIVDAINPAPREVSVASGSLVGSMAAFVFAIGSLAAFAIANIP
jgi:hypothetical protein